MKKREQRYKVWLTHKQIFLVSAAFQGTQKVVEEPDLKEEMQEVVQACQEVLKDLTSPNK